MSDFEPGEGSREATDQEVVDRATGVEYVMQWRKNGGARYWVREELVPPLPTEPYTVIRVNGRPATDSSLFVLTSEDEWSNAVDAMFLTATDLRGCITGFEVLASPIDQPLNADWYREHIAKHDEKVRRETAKAVLEAHDALWTREEIVKHFGLAR